MQLFGWSPHVLLFQSPFINPLATVPRARITISINATFIFHSFFDSLARLRYLSFFSLSSNFTQWSTAYYHYYYTPSEFLCLLFSGGDSLESEWQQVIRTFLRIFADLSNPVFSMVSIPFPFLPLHFVNIWELFRRTNNNWYFQHPHVPQVFYFFGKIQVFVNVFAFLYFHSLVRWKSKSTRQQVFFFFLFLFFFFFFFCSFATTLNLKILENFAYLIFKEGFWFVHIPFCRMVKFQFLS